MRAIEVCRTQELGGHLKQCDTCGFEHPSYNSCRNRHCPKCQSLAKAKWLQKQTSELLPVGYFHLVFTLPHELNRLILTRKKILLALLFKAVSETLLDFGQSRFGATLGIIAVLHTWDQTLKDHFHLHCLVG
jgi:Transposase zinc-binding domain/Putative transposase